MQLRSDEGEANLGGAKPKALLTALLLQARQVVSADRLIDLVWDEAPPQSAGALVHTYVSLLRRTFASLGVDGVLATRSPGYLLDVDHTASDLGAFEQRVATARRAERAGDAGSAVTEYERALALWRGPALGGVSATFARVRAAGLEEDRLAAEEGWARACLAVGRAAEVVSRLDRLTAAHPLREEARGLLMRALHETGRQVDALAVYRDTRVKLLDELGIEPGEALRDLHRSILDGTLAVPVVAPPVVEVVGEPREVPRHLPPDIGDFTGRERELARLTALAEQASGRGTATPTAVVAGVGGAGKSALAVHAAHRLFDRFPDGQLFADLRGSGGDLDAHEVLRRFLGALGVTELPDGADERVERYRREVAGRRMLVVLDNARGEHQVRSLLPGNPQCMVIITSRSRLTGLEGVVQVELDVLGSAASVEMLRRVVGASRVDAEPDEALRIARLCAGVPLALRAAAAKLLAKPHWRLRSLASRLSDERRRLDELAVGDLAVRSSLRLNYAELDDVHRRAFHLLALLDLPDFGSWLASPLLGIDLDDAEDVVEELVDLRLVDVIGTDALGRVRYRFHDLVQLFGAEQASVEPPEVVGAAVTRALATWMALVEAGARRLPRMTVGLHPKLAEVVELDPRLVAETEDDPIGWLKSETSAVVRAVERGHELGIDRMTTMLMTALLSSPFAVRNEFDGWQRTHETALAAARAGGDRQSEAVLLAGLGQVHYEKDDFVAALDFFAQAHTYAVAVGDEVTRAVALIGLGTTRRDLAGFAEAEADLRAAVEVAERIGDDGLIAAARYGLGSISRDLGNLADAEDQLTRCAESHRRQGDARGEGLALRGVGLCARAAGEVDRAVELSARARDVLRAVGDELGAAYAEQSLVKAELRRGAVAGLEERLAACLDLCEAQRDRFGVALMTRTLGEVALARGDLPAAREWLGTALELWTDLRLAQWRARTLRDLAAAEDGEPVDGDPADGNPADGHTAVGGAAARHWAEALELFTALRCREAGELAGLTPADWRRHVLQSGL